jgi:GNAT superfamily N-acetyltransferase
MNPVIQIRQAKPDDAAAVSVFAAQSFYDAYASANDPEDMALHLKNTFSPERQRAEILSAGTHFLLAFSGSELAAYAWLRSDLSHPTIAEAKNHELRRFYVGQQWHGQGVAAKLMEAILGRARDARALGVWLTAWSLNPRALRFYQKQGFIDVGESTFLLGKDLQTDRVLVHPL